MTKMPDLLLTSSLDPIDEGQVFTKGLPPHVTIWQYFQLSKESQMQDFVDEIGGVAEGFAPIEIEGMRNDMFGPNEDVLVRRVRSVGRGATLATIHHALGEVIGQHGGTVRNPEWAHDNYNPHITYVNDKALGEGERAVLRTVELIEKAPGSQEKVVRNVWKLS